MDKGLLLTYNSIVKTSNKQEYQVGTAPTTEQKWTEVLMMDVKEKVSVVRCKDCKHYKPQKKSAHWENRTNYCNRIVTIKVQPYDFCSYGEWKEGDK